MGDGFSRVGEKTERMENDGNDGKDIKDINGRAKGRKSGRNRTEERQRGRQGEEKTLLKKRKPFLSFGEPHPVFGV
jgi:hypothetical protein